MPHLVAPAYVVLSLLLWAVVAHAQEDGASTVPKKYRVITNRTIQTKPGLPALGPAGYRFNDPTFGTRVLRVSDANTRPGFSGRSFTTPSAAHQLAWNAASDLFYIRSIDGTFIPYDFNPITMTVSRILPSALGNGGLTIASQVEPQFSFLSSNVLFGSRQDPVNDWPIVRQFDFNTLTYADLVNLGAVTTVLPSTYAGALSSSATAPEKLSVMFGGIQDTHYKVAVFQVSPAGANPVILDSRASTITRNGLAANTNVPLGFFLHHAWIDQSGRYVLLYPANATPAPYFVWDLETDSLTQVSSNATGHDAIGFGRQINQACCTTSGYDAAQWQLRTLAAPASTTDLINPVLAPQEVYLADHTSWNNARADTLTPILSASYRYFNDTLNTTPWRAWDDEIVAIETAAGTAGATVWRFAHHRSDVSSDGSQAVYFWYLPRAVISPDGRWAIFTSNWQKTLGSSVDTDIEPGGAYRCDVFLIALAKGGVDTFTDDPLSIGSSVVKAAHVTELRSRIDGLRAQFGLAAFSWTDAIPDSGIAVKAVHISELRTALLQAYTAAGRTAPAFIDSSLVPAISAIRVVHIQELRDAVIHLETS